MTNTNKGLDKERPNRWSSILVGVVALAMLVTAVAIVSVAVLRRMTLDQSNEVTPVNVGSLLLAAGLVVAASILGLSIWVRSGRREQLKQDPARQDGRPAGSKRSPDGQERRSVGSVVLVLLVVCIVALVLVPVLTDNSNLYLLAPLQVILGSLVFLLGLTLIVVVFVRLGLQDRTRPLGLPDGTVRALLALVIIVVFVIFGNIIYGQLQSSGPRTQPFTVGSMEAVDALEDQGTVVRLTESTTTPGTFSGTLLLPSQGEESRELGQQIVTALITLVTAITAFYFGSGSVAAAASAIRSDGGRFALRRPALPVSLKRRADGSFEPIEFALDISALGGASARATVVNDSAGSVKSFGTADTYVYEPSKPIDPVTITFVALDSSGRELVVLVTVPTDLAVVDEPVVDEPVVDEPVVDEPVVDEPPADEPDHR